MKKLISLAAMSGLLLVACGDDDKKSDTTNTTPAGGAFDLATLEVNDEAKACAEGNTLEAGKLVLATGDPAYPPYMLDDDPTTGEGFESAVALAVAKVMGFDGDAVSWVRTSFDSAVAGSDTNFDFNLQQFSINAEREDVVSFSDPYYTANQAILGYADGPGKDVTKLSDLKALKLGAAAGTTSLQFITDVIKPDTAAFEFGSNADAKAALDAGQIDAIISDVPTALYWSVAAEEDGGVPGTTVFGQFSIDAGGAGDQWGLLFVKDNPLVECVNLALADLESTGALAAITEQWMAGYTEAPTLSKD
ncbi:MAG: transporter substrate-binding domain-containing protein [Actinomycetota bacterium]|nr:transporter substrate-binding domain-containing protein [Actinomycetota bacterium]